jgi:hypothetical protein
MAAAYSSIDPKRQSHMSAKDRQLQGAFGEAIAQVKARMARIDEPRLKAFIEKQPQVRGAVAMGPLSYPSGGAGASNGIGFFTAEMDRGEGRRSYDLVLRYSPGISLLKQKSFSDEFLTIEAVRRERGVRAPAAYNS